MPQVWQTTKARRQIYSGSTRVTVEQPTPSALEIAVITLAALPILYDKGLLPKTIEAKENVTDIRLG